jgi:multidrug resistance efflux pump
MIDESSKLAATPATGADPSSSQITTLAPEPDPPQPPPVPASGSGKGSRLGALVVLVLIVASLTWYFVADRLTPHTSQARVQAFVVPVAAEVSGKVIMVHVKDNDVVRPGQALFDIDPVPYRIALARSRSDYELVRLSVNGSTAAVDAARASLQAARANRISTDQNARRLELIYSEDSGAISLRRVEMVRADRIKARSQEEAAEADLRRALEAAGEAGDNNAQLLSARSAIEKAELDLARTNVAAPAGGLVTDLQTDVGRFAQAGSPVMTLIAVHDLWISADMTENNLGNVEPGDRVDILLDVMPGEVLKGRVRSVGGGVSDGKQAKPGDLPTIDNSRDWLRQSQRFPVAVEFDPSERERLRGVRIGGQADVLIYTGDHALMNWLGRLFIVLSSYLSYLY